MTPEERDRLLTVELTLGRIKDDLDAIREVTDSLKTQSTYVRGALLVAIAIGGIITWALNVWGSFK